MIKHSLLILVPVFTIFLLTADASAQGYYKFLGDSQSVPDRYSQRNGIRYNTQGFDNPTQHNVDKMIKKGADPASVQTVLNYPGSSDAVDGWVDSAFEQTKQEFEACGGSLAARGSRVSANGVYVVIEPTAFFVPELGYAVAGAYFPATHEIHSLSIYYTWSGQNKGWLRQAKDILKWEMENYFAVETGIQAEPRTPNWPCDAPAAH